MPETRTVKGFSEDGLPLAEGDFEFSPVMTNSIPPHTSVSYHKFFRCATPESIILPPAACNRGEGAVVWTDVCWSGTEDMIM